MATLTIRSLSESTKRALKARAARNDRSMEAEARDILQAAVSADQDFITGWLDRAAEFRDDFPSPDRSPARSVDLD
jgi:plasmid stability protein